MLRIGASRSTKSKFHLTSDSDAPYKLEKCYGKVRRDRQKANFISHLTATHSTN
ncbi:MAG: hypothetical protein HC941_17370 [Microcoleus sp. SU_5_3]|nr:hypothetical protein [Microcoleus sp. SU_5_3]